VKNAQHSVNSHILISFKETRISRILKFASEARGAFPGNLAWMKAFSFGVSHEAWGGTIED